MMVQDKDKDFIKLSKEYYCSVVNHIFDGIITIDGEGIIESFNPAAERIFGYKSDEVIGKNVSILIPPPYSKNHQRYINNYLKTGEAKIIGKRREAETKRKDGSIFPVELFVSKFHFENEQMFMGIVHDISERKKVELKLKESEEKCRTIFENVIDGILLTDMETKKFFTSNKRMSQMLGYSSEEIKNLSVTDIYSKEILPQVLEEFEKTCGGELSVIRDITVRRKHGGIFYADIGLSVITLNSKRYIVGIFRDNTEHKFASEALKKVQQRNKAFLNAMPDLLFMFSREGIFLDFNINKKDMLPVDPEVFLGKNIRDILPRKIVQKILYCTEEAFQTGNIQIVEFKLRIPLKRGRLYYFETRIIQSGEDEALAIIRDISERKQAEEKIHALSSRLNALIDNMQAGILFEDKSGNVLYVNEKFTSMFDIPSPMVILGIDHSAALEKSKYLFEEMEDFVQRTEDILKERQIVKDEEIRLVDGRVFERDYIPVENKDMFLGNLWNYRDVTKRKREEEKRRMLENELTRSEKSAALGKVAASIAHEINNPASVIQNDLYLIQEYAAGLTDLAEKSKIKGILSRDEDAISRIVNIVAAMKGAYRPEEWHFIDINKEIDLQLILLYKKYKNRIRIKKYYSTLPQIKSYGSEFGQVILNLLDNAIDAIQEKGEIMISTRYNDGLISINIKDTGTGIPKDEIPYIFDPFFTKKETGKGIGLGLYTSFQIVKRHKGKIFVAKTKVGKGTTFKLELPKEIE